MKIAILNDTHLGIRNSSEIFLDNASKFYTDIFFPYCKKHNITKIIHLGDYYDNRRNINIKALYHNRKNFLEPMRDLGMSMDIIPGNHDVYFKNSNEINSLKECLGFFIKEISLIMKPTEIDYGKTKIALIPWINQSNHDNTLEFIKKSKADILAGHFEFAEFNLMKGVKSKHGLDHKLFSKFDKVLSGHFHTKSTRDNVYYLGSQMEFFWSDASDPKYFHVLDTDDLSLIPVENPHTLFEKIIYDDTEFDFEKFDLSRVDNKFVKVIVVEKNDKFLFDKFIDKIQDRKIHELKIAENFSEFLGENIDDESISVENTEDLLNSYIDQVDTNLDKDRIKKEINKLLKRAQTLEVL